MGHPLCYSSGPVRIVSLIPLFSVASATGAQSATGRALNACLTELAAVMTSTFSQINEPILDTGDGSVSGRIIVSP